MFTLRNLFGLAALALGASALVMDPMFNVERDVAATAHRRHAANVLNLRSPAPRPSMAQRRSLRQKRCLASPSTTPAATSTTVDTGDSVPQNVAPDPTPQADTPAVVNQPAPTPSASDDNNNDNSGSQQPPANTGGDGDTHSGDLTFYDVGLGACGGTNTDSDMIAAASMLLYDGFDGYTGGNPNNNPICNKQVAITYGGNTITVTIVDRCVGCAEYDLDLSPTAFSQLADQSIGRLHGATWNFL